MDFRGLKTHPLAHRKAVTEIDRKFKDELKMEDCWSWGLSIERRAVDPRSNFLPSARTRGAASFQDVTRCHFRETEHNPRVTQDRIRPVGARGLLQQVEISNRHFHIHLHGALACRLHGSCIRVLQLPCNVTNGILRILRAEGLLQFLAEGRLI